MAHTRSRNSRIFVGRGDALVSNHRRTILTIEEDTSPGQHDILLCACNLWIYRELGVAAYHRNCSDNLHEALAAGWGFARVDALAAQSVHERAGHCRWAAGSCAAGQLAGRFCGVAGGIRCRGGDLGVPAGYHRGQRGCAEGCGDGGAGGRGVIWRIRPSPRWANPAVTTRLTPIRLSRAPAARIPMFVQKLDPTAKPAAIDPPPVVAPGPRSRLWRRAMKLSAALALLVPDSMPRWRSVDLSPATTRWYPPTSSRCAPLSPVLSPGWPGAWVARSGAAS